MLYLHVLQTSTRVSFESQDLRSTNGGRAPPPPLDRIAAAYLNLVRLGFRASDVQATLRDVPDPLDAEAALEALAELVGAKFGEDD